MQHSAAAITNGVEIVEHPALSCEPRPKTSRFIVEDFDTIEPHQTADRVKNVWPRRGVCTVISQTRGGKTFLLLDAAGRICRGLPFLGHRSAQCGVVYIGSEGASGLRKRIKGLRNEIGPLGGAFKFIGQAPDLTDAEDFAELRQTILAARLGMSAIGHELGVAFVDTMSASMPGADENSAKDMSPVLTRLQALAGDLEILIVLAHHLGKDETRGARGWSGITANADGVISIDLKEDGGEAIRLGKIAKVKDGPSGETFTFALRQVQIGIDDWGEAETTCVVDYTDSDDVRGRVAVLKAPKLKGAAQRIMMAFGRLHDAGRTVAAPDAPGVRPGIRAVSLADLRETTEAIGLVADPEPPEESAERTRWLAARRAAWKRGIEDIENRGALRIEGGFAWNPNHGKSAPEQLNSERD